jgi:hypothetical protein
VRKKRKAIVSVPGSSLVRCGTVSTCEEDFHRRILVTSSGKCSGIKMEFYFKKLVMFAC